MDTQELSLVIRDDNAVATSEDFDFLKREALIQASQVIAVDDDEQNRIAVEAQLELAAVIKRVKNDHELVKAPYLKICQTLDTTKRTILEELSKEEYRVGLLRGNYETVQLQKKRAAEAAENAKLAEIERQKAAELAKAQTHDQIDAVQEKFDAKVKEQQAQASPILSAPKPRGSVNKEVWEYEVNDINLLYRAHPTCVKLEALPSEIKALLDAGVAVRGITTPKKVVAAGVRVPKQEKAINV